MAGPGGKSLLVCNCEGTMPLDGRTLARACGAARDLPLHHQLCRGELDALRRAFGEAKPVLVACTQERVLFEEVRGELPSPAPISYANIRERAGWSDEGDKATPKIAALLAEAALELPAVPTVALKSEGTLLVYGTDERAIDAAQQLKGRLEVTVLLTRPGELAPPRVTEMPLFKGTIVAAKGHLGAFEVIVNDHAPALPSSRATLAFAPGRDGARAQCDLILDLSGGAPLFPAHRKRDGYKRPDPGNPTEIQRALFELTDLVGTFDKPRYIEFRAELCVHARSRKTGCTRCLDVCPASAIAPAGDHVAIDPLLCAGCGSCASVCPTGAASYALPPTEPLFERLRVLLLTYRAAGGTRPVLLLHDGRHGEEMISALARFGRGLPARVIPFTLNEVSQIGFEFLVTAFAYGASQILLLADPRRAEDRAGLPGQLGLAAALMSGLGFGADRLSLLDAADPEAVERALWTLDTPTAPEAASFLAMGDKRSIALLALRHLHAVAAVRPELLPLPPGASFGRIALAAEGCTLCLACVGACPTGALLDNPDKPQLGFREEACVQCGLCRSTCPEHVIGLEPRLNFTPAAQDAVILKEEEPFLCIRCGKPFASRASIEKVVGKLAGSHWMFRDPARVARLKMCEDCRVIDEFEGAPAPLAARPRPRPRTTEDYLRERKAEELRAKLRAEWETSREREDGSGHADDEPKGPGKP